MPKVLLRVLENKKDDFASLGGILKVFYDSPLSLVTVGSIPNRGHISQCGVDTKLADNQTNSPDGVDSLRVLATPRKKDALGP